jgi:hypothetical protein
MTIWYVNSATGLDTYNGTALATPFATIQKAANSTAAGDTVYILPGNGYGGGTGGTPVLSITTSGTSGNPITYSGYPGGARPVITGTQSFGAILGTATLAYITVNYLEVAGWQASLTWANIVANSASGTPLTSHVYNGYGISFSGNTPASTANTVYNITVTNCLVHDFPGNGIAVNYGDYINVSANTVYNCGFYSPAACSGISLYEQHNIDAGTGTKCYVTGNTIYNCYNYVPDNTSVVKMTTNAATAIGNSNLNFSATPGTSNYTMFALDATHAAAIPQGSYISYYPSGTTIGMTQNIASPGVSSGDVILFGYVTDGEGIIIDNNSNTQSDSVAYVGRTLISNNLIFNCGMSGISIAASSHCDVVFNTVYQTQQSVNSSSLGGEINNTGCTDSNIYNNICVATTTAPSGWDQSTSTTTWANNAFSGGNAAHTLPGSNNVTSAPSFIAPGLTPSANFMLQSGSTMIGVASATYSRTQAGVSSLPGSYGSSFGAVADIGAYEFHTAPTLTVS